MTPITPVDQKVDALQRQQRLHREVLVLLLRLMLTIQRHRVRSMSDPEGHLRGAQAERELEVMLDRI